MIVKNDSVDFENCGEGVKRKILAHDGSLMMVEVVFEKNAVGPDHSHINEQITYVAAGSFTFVLNGIENSIQKGDSLYIPPNFSHSAKSLEENSVLIDIFSPQRYDFIKSDVETSR